MGNKKSSPLSPQQFRFLPLLFCAVGVFYGTNPEAQAQSSTWTDGSGNGLWTDAGNWSAGVPGPNTGDVATFNLGTGTSTINLSGAQSSGGIVFAAGAQSYTIGIAGVDSINLAQTPDNTDNDSAIVMNATVTADQTIAADIILGDGAGTTQFSDQIDIVNFSTTNNLIITGDISTGTGAGPGDVQRLIWGGFTSSATTTTFSGTVNETSPTISASRIDNFVGGAELTWSGTTNLTTNNYLRTLIRDNGTLTLAAGSDIGTGFMEVRSGTLNINSNQTFANGLTVGSTSQGDTNAEINIDGAVTINLESNFEYNADTTFDNVATVSGGTIQITGDNRVFTINDQAGVTGAEVTISSNITNDGTARTITKNNAGTLALSGTNSYGNTVVNNGLIIVSGGDALSDTGLVTLNQNGSLGNLQLDSDETIGSLSGTGNVEVGTSRLTLGDATNTDFSGLLTGTSGGLTKVGTGTLTLSNVGTHTFTGDTNIDAGQLTLEGVLSGNVVVGNSGNIGGEGGTTGNLTFGTGAYTLDANASTSAALSTTGNLDVSNATSITVNITGSGAGDVTILSYGTRSGSGIGAGGGNFTLGSIANPTARGFQGFSDTGSAIVANLGSVVNTWQGTDLTNPNFWDVGTTANWSNSADSVFQQGDAVIFDDTASQFAVSRQEDVTVSDITFSNVTNAYTFTAQTGIEILTIEGTVNANNSNTVDINGPVAVTSGLNITGTGDLNFNGVISGSGGLTKSGTGTTTLTSAPTYAGNTNINEGRLVFSAGAISTASDFTHVIASGATLEYNVPGTGSNNDPTSLDISGEGTFVKTGPGTFSLISSGSDFALGANGLIQVAEGTFSFGGPTPGRWGSNLADMQIDSGASFQGRATSIVIDTLTGDGTFGVGGRNTGDGTGIGLTLGVNNGTGVFNGVIQDSTNWGTGFDTGDFNLQKVGTGTQTLNGNNTYTGETTISAGQLNIGGTNVSEFIVGDGTGSGANLGGEGSTTGNITFTESTHTLSADASTTAALGSTGTGALDVSALSVGGFTVDLTGTAATGASGVTVLTYGSGGFTGDVDRFTLGTGAVRAALAGAFTDDGNGNITVNVGNVANTWRGADATNPTFWNVGTTANWSNSADAVFQQGDSATFDDTALSQVATLQENITADSITFDNNSKSITINAAGSEILTVGGAITTNGTGGATINAGLTSSGDGVTFDGANDLTVGGIISGTDGIIKNGAGTVKLTAVNSFTGTVNVNAGTLKFDGVAIASGSSNRTTVIGSGATLEFDVGSGNRSSDTFDHGGDGTFLKTGTAEFSQTSANSDITYTANGLIHVAEGTYNFGGSSPGNWSANRGSMLINAGATFQARSTSITLDALDGAGTFGVGGQVANGPGLILGISGGSGVFTGVVQNTSADGAAFSIEKRGVGRQELSGANTYTGDTTVTEGTLIVNGTLGGNISVATGASIGGSATTSGTITFADNSSLVEVNGATGPLTTTEGTTGLDLTGVSTDGINGITVDIAVGGAGVFSILDYGGVATGFTAGSGEDRFILGTVTPTASARGDGSGVIDDNGTAITFDLGYEARTWSATNTGNWTDANITDNSWIEGDNDYFDGDLVVFTEDSVVTGAPTTNQTVTLTTNVAPTDVDFTNSTISYTINSTGSETITSASDIDVTGNGGVTINSAIAGTSGINKSGTGILTLGGANTFSGPVTVTDGTLTLGANNVIGDTVDIAQTGGFINFIDGVVETVNSIQSTGGTVILGFSNGAGAADLTLNDDSSINNVTIGSDSFLRLADGANLTINGLSQLGNTDSVTFDVGTGAEANVTGGINTGNGGGEVNKTGNGILRLTNDGSAWGGGTRITGGILEFTSISNVGSVDVVNDSSLGNADTQNVLQIGSASTAATLRMTGTNAKNSSDRLVQLGDAGGTIDVQDAAQTLTLTGVISNDTANGSSAGSLTKAGAGTLVLGADNTYSGTTTIASGTLQVGTGGADGSIGNLTANVINNGALVLNVSDNNTYSGVISGTGTVALDGSGTTTFSGDNTYTGSTSVNAGTLLVTGDSSAATGNVTVASGATLGGTGTIGGNTDFTGGTLSAATTTTVGTLNFTGDLGASSSSTWLVDLNNAVSGETDLIALGDISTRMIDLTNFNLSLNDFGAFTEGTGFTYDIATYTDTNGPLTSTFAGLANGSQINGGTGQYIITYGNQDGFGGNDYSIRLTAVPEPTTFLLLLPLLLAGFWMMRRRKLRAEKEATPAEA